MCGCLLHTPHRGPGSKPTHALTGNWTGDLLVRRLELNPLSYTSQGHKELLQLNNKMTKKLGKIGIILRHFTKACIFVAKKYMKKCAISSDIRKTQIKLTTSSYYTPTKMGATKKSRYTRCWHGFVTDRNSHTCLIVVQNLEVWKKFTFKIYTYFLPQTSHYPFT